MKDDLGESQNSSIYGACFFAKPDNNLIIDTLFSGDESELILSCDFGELTLPQLRSMNFLARLYKRTGIPFHEIDWLLQIFDASESPNSSDDDEGAYRSIEDLGFEIIAHFIYYRQHFEVSVDEFVALLWQVNPYYRLDMEEISFLRQLFGDDAPVTSRSGG